MECGDTKFKLVSQTEKSKMVISESGIRIITGDQAPCPLGVVTIIPGVQLELGRSIAEFIDCLKRIRKPLATQVIGNPSTQAKYRILRLCTGNVPGGVVCSIATVQGKIVSVTFNQDLAYDKNFLKYQGLSIIHRLTAGKDGDNQLLANSVKAVATITGKSASNFRIKEVKTSIIVYTDMKETKNVYRYTFSKDKMGYYNLLSVGFMVTNKDKKGV